MRDLAHFQDDFAAALRREPVEDRLAGGAAAIGLDIYRNTIAKGATDALAANYPTVQRLVGEEWFRACAHDFFAAFPPATPMLHDYGEEFPAFLAAFRPAQELPYLASVAQIDRLWLRAHFAADAEPLEPSCMANAHCAHRPCLKLHAATRVAWFDAPAPTIWRLNRPPAPAPGEAGWTFLWRAEGIILARPGGAVLSRLLDRGGFEFLAACRRGESLVAAVEAAEHTDPTFKVADWLPEFVSMGAFASP